MLLQSSGEELRCLAAFDAREYGRRSCRNDASAFIPCARSHIDDPIATRDDLHIVLNHNHGVAGVDKVLQLPLQTFNVDGMKSGGGLVQYIQRIAALGTLQFGGKLTRCASPPESSVAACPRRRYPRPTSCNTSKARATCASSAKNSAAASTVKLSTSAMFFPR